MANVPSIRPTLFPGRGGWHLGVRVPFYSHEKHRIIASKFCLKTKMHTTASPRFLVGPHVRNHPEAKERTVERRSCMAPKRKNPVTHQMSIP